ncbi:MAG TPA: 50S ribosomal protein L11 methyltransferase [Chitinophagaceae bacterium]|nr:50S ribosomal protein L11 methyltransferase [Chitinophagaceae bacterium]
MSRYIQIQFQNISQQQSDILIARLNEIGFEGFQEEENELKAFITSTAFDENLLQHISSSLQLNFSKTIIEETNWNQIWESNFDPVIVDDFVAVRADFHKPVKKAAFEIVITPKMSFGTGHHATTYMMMQQMREIDFAGKTVFDFGTGTGVLAILAEKLGARAILAIDNDSWSIENTAENITRNGCTKIDLKLADTAITNDSFDIILANINKNVILDNFQLLAKQLLPGGILLLSGLLAEDKQDILSKAGELNLQLLTAGKRHNWLFIKLSH